jgi:hypothetical protein
MSSDDIYKDGKPNKEIYAYVLKDHSDSINGKIFTFPTFKHFKPIINFIQGLPIGEVAEETTGNLIPTDKEYYERQLQKKIETEKIEAVFELNNLGSPRSAEEKKLKTMIIQKIFGTTSKTEIEKLDGPKLNYLRQELEDFFTEYNTREDKAAFIECYNKVAAA